MKLLIGTLILTFSLSGFELKELKAGSRSHLKSSFEYAYKNGYVKPYKKINPKPERCCCSLLDTIFKWYYWDN